MNTTPTSQAASCQGKEARREDKTLTSQAVSCQGKEASHEDKHQHLRLSAVRVKRQVMKTKHQHLRLSAVRVKRRVMKTTPTSISVNQSDRSEGNMTWLGWPWTFCKHYQFLARSPFLHISFSVLLQ